MSKRTLWSIGYALAAFVALPLGATAGNDDFVTGAGWITGTPSGAKGNFGAAGGIKDGAFWGHLHYVDHGSGMYVKSTAVTGYAVDPNDSTCRIVDYNVLIGWLPGTARIRVCDKGEPGVNDIFQIQLSNGYFAGGDLGGSGSGGGNVQLHVCRNGAGAGVCSDVVTAGGWITGTPSGAAADFGAAGGIKKGVFWGHLDFVDH